jgi:tetratricopeptide (TPR) repeat protein
MRYQSVLVLLIVASCAAQYRDYTGLPFTPEFSAPPAIGRNETMKSPPPDGSYVAFSLTAARNTLSGTRVGANYRETAPEVFTLGGMTHILGVLVDPATGDLILVGKRDAARQPVTLDDFVIALRSVFVQGEWPLVSIDPTGEGAPQVVRFEGGISNTQFGADLLAADYTLKTISFDIEVPKAGAPPSMWNLLRKRVSGSRSDFRINSRFWFYPILPSVLVRDGVAAIRDLKVAVFSALDSATMNGRDVTKTIDPDEFGDVRFAKWFTDQFAQLSSEYVSVNRLRGLEELTALAASLEKIDYKVDLEYWLKQYNVRRVETPATLALVRRRERTVSPNSATPFSVSLSGGVELTALALRVRSGDVSALKRAVLSTRPSPGSTTWSFVVGNWIIPVQDGGLSTGDATRLYAEFAGFLARGHYEEAGLCLDKLQTLGPPFADDVRIGRVELQMLRFHQTMLRSVGSYGIQVANGGFPQFILADKEFRLANIQSAIRVLREQNRRTYETSLLEGILFSLQGRLAEADALLTKAIDLGDQDGVAQHTRGLIRLMTGHRREGIADIERALLAGPPDALRQPWEETLRQVKSNPDDQTWQVYKSIEDGIEFSYPADWTVVAARDPQLRGKLQTHLEKMSLPPSYIDSVSSIAEKTLGRGVVVFNTSYDFCVINIEMREMGQAPPRAAVKQSWESQFAQTADLERKNSILKGFAIKKIGVIDRNNAIIADFTYDFRLDVAEFAMPHTGRRVMVYQNSAPQRVARMEFTTAEQLYPTINSYFTKIVDTLKLSAPSASR